MRYLLADKGYDADRLRRSLRDFGSICGQTSGAVLGNYGKDIEAERWNDGLTKDMMKVHPARGTRRADRSVAVPVENIAIHAGIRLQGIF